MVPPKTLGLGKFWPNLEISGAFLMGLKVSFADGFCVPESLNFCADGFQTCLFSFHFVFRSQIFQSSYEYSLSN